MSYTDLHHLIALLNLALWSGVGWICLCRLDQMSRSTLRSQRAVYALLLSAATLAGWQPVLVREWPGVADLFVAVSVLAYLMAGVKRWKHGVPDYATAPGELGGPEIPNR